MGTLVLTETRDALALVTLNRPEKLNALSYAMIDELMAVLDILEDEPAIRAVVLKAPVSEHSLPAPISTSSS